MENPDQEMKEIEKIRQYWHGVFAPFNVGREFVVLCGGDTIALLQLDGGGAINGGNIQPVDKDGNNIRLMVNTGEEKAK